MAEAPLFAFDSTPASLDAIDRVEVRLGVRIPDAYRHVLASIGNGGPVRSARPLGVSAMVGFDGLFGVERGDWYDLEAVVGRLLGRIPEWFIPFAESPGGNLVGFSIHEEHEGTVWFWDHELELAGNAVSRLADSVSEFLEALDPSEPDPGSPKPTVRSVKIRNPEFHQRLLDEQRARRNPPPSV